MIGCIMLAMVAACGLRAAEVTPTSLMCEAKEQREERLQWWREARFGLFVHWGPVSLAGTELSWSRGNSNPQCPNQGEVPAEMYDILYKRFNPVKFNADEWVSIAKIAGMKYMVLTAKHCDGFLLWHSKVSEYNMAATPFKRDICAELSAAARRQGMRLGWYFSPMDWRDPDCRNAGNAKFVQRMQAELTELLSNYGKMDVLWFDADGESAPWDQENTYALVRRLQPSAVVNNRLDMGSISQYHAQRIGPWADFYTPEQRIGSFDVRRPWETCMTLGTQWSWKPNDRIKSAEECIKILVRCVGGDGNLLLDVGPRPSGEIEPGQVEVLKGIGAWLTRYGQSIYGTRGGPYKPNRNLACTHKGKVVYVHVLKWEGGEVELPPLGKRIVTSRLLTGGRVEVTQDGKGVTLAVATADQQPIDTIVMLELDGAAGEIAPIQVGPEEWRRTMAENQ